MALKSSPKRTTIRRAVKLWMKVKKGKKIAYMRSRGAGGPQARQNDGAVALKAGQNGPAKSITKSEAGTQTAQEFVELVGSEKKTRSGNKSFLF